MLDLEVIEDPEAAEVSLDPIRSRLLAELAEPASASSLADRGLPRQNVNYHLRALEEHGLVELVEERKKGNMTERVLQATALSYVISPSALNGVEPDPSRAGPALGPVVDRGCLEARPRRRRARGRVDEGPQAPRDVRDGRRDPLRLGGGPLGVRRGAGRLGHFAGKQGITTTPRGRDHRVVVAVHPSLKPDAPEAQHDTETEGI